MAVDREQIRQKRFHPGDDFAVHYVVCLNRGSAM